MKNITLLILFIWVTVSYAKEPIVQESLSDAESYKIEKPVQEQDAQRSLAGSKMKKQKKDFSADTFKEEKPVEGDGEEIKYWKYSEE